MGLFEQRKELVNKLTKYCGSFLDCINVKSGECYDSIFNKINKEICELKTKSDIIISENPNCDNGGIIVRDRNIRNAQTGEYEIIYETCFPCCGSDDCKEYGFPTPNGTDNFWHIENLNDDDNFTTSTSVNNLYNNGISLRVNNFNLNAPLEYVIPNFASNITPLVSGVDYLINIGNVNVNFPQDGIVLFSVSLGDGVNASAKTLVTGSNVSFVLKAEAGVNYSQNDLIIKVNSLFLSLIETDAVLEIQNISVSSVECSDNNCKDCVKYPINKPNSSNNTWNNIDGVNSTSMTIGYENLLNITGGKLNNGFNTKVTGFKDNNGDLIADEGNYCFEAFVYMKTTVKTNTCFTVQFGDGVGATVMSFCKDSGIEIDKDIRLYHIKQNIKAVSGVSTSKDEMLITMTNLMSENIPVDFLIYNFTLDPIDCCCGSDDDCACLPEPPSDGGTYGVNNGEWVKVGGNSCCDNLPFITRQVHYMESRSGLIPSGNPDIDDSNPNALYSSNFNYTITPENGDGMYEVLFTSGWTQVPIVIPDVLDGLSYGIYVNGVAIDTSGVQSAFFRNIGTDNVVIPSSWYQSNIQLNVGDNIGIWISNNGAVVQHTNWVIRRIG